MGSCVHLSEMAENAGLTFHTPEEYFLSQPIDPNWAYKSNFDPKRWDHSGSFSGYQAPLLNALKIS